MFFKLTLSLNSLVCQYEQNKKIYGEMEFNCEVEKEENKYFSEELWAEFHN